MTKYTFNVNDGYQRTLSFIFLNQAEQEKNK